MTKSEAIAFFGGTQESLARALGIKQWSVAEWGEYPPELRQLQLQILSRGKLKAEPYCLPESSAA
jgi:hypothetical protein